MNRTLSGAIACAGLMLLGGCGEKEPEPAPAVEAPAAPAPAPVDEGAFLDPNTATRDQLMTAPGVDAPLADALVAGRPYSSMTAVDEVVGGKLTEEQKDALYARVWMPVDINKASEEEFLLIPGVGDRMAHEFEEYRPYDAPERFRREIGKYVDATEVARLERYVVFK